MEPVLDTGTTAWLLVSTALVFIMIPGLAFFYGGMNRSKSVLNMLMMVIASTFGGDLIDRLRVFHGLRFHNR